MCGPGNLLGITRPLSCCSVRPNHVLVDSLCSLKVFKSFSRSIHYSKVKLKCFHVKSYAMKVAGSDSLGVIISVFILIYLVTH